MEKINKCPFCLSNKVDTSIKTAGSRNRYYQVAVYCRRCHAYGPRVISNASNYDKVTDIDIGKAIKLWNLGDERE